MGWRRFMSKRTAVMWSRAWRPCRRAGPTRASLASLGEPGIEATLARINRDKNGHATEPDLDDAERTGTYCVGRATGDGQRFRILRPHA